MSSDALVVTSTDGAVRVVTLNRPEALNALSLALQRELDVFAGRSLSAETIESRRASLLDRNRS